MRFQLNVYFRIADFSDLYDIFFGDGVKQTTDINRINKGREILRGLDNYVEEPREDLSYLFISDESEKSNISLPSKGREDVLPGFE